jgi:hypothetical protein
MDSLTQGSALPNIKTTDTTVTQGPDWYNNALSNLGTTTTNALNLANTNPESTVANFGALTKSAMDMAPGLATSYQAPLAAATSAATDASQGITPGAIESYLNPYATNVVNEMARLSNQNMTRNTMPALSGAFAGTGGFGSQRYANAMGQSAADTQANLSGLQSKSLAEGYKQAMDTAHLSAQDKIAAANSLNNQANTATTSGTAALKDLTDLGALDQARRQAVINAPLDRASKQATILGSLKVPSTVIGTKDAPIPGAYSNSPLSQLAGLATLFNSTTGGASAVTGFLKTLLGDKGYDDIMKDGGILGSLTKSVTSPPATTPPATTTNPTRDPQSRFYGMTQNEDGTYSDRSGNIYDAYGTIIYAPNIGTGDPGNDNYEPPTTDEEPEY